MADDNLPIRTNNPWVDDPLPTRTNNPWAAYMSPPEQLEQDPIIYQEPIVEPGDAPPPYCEAYSSSSIPAREDRQIFPHHTRPTYSEPPYPTPAGHPSVRRSSSASNEDQILAQALEFTTQRQHHQLPPAQTPHQPLPKPVAIPQIAPGLGLPFTRAYSHDLLSKRNISAESFLEFIDNLNLVSTASPPLQVLDLAGGVVGMVPHHIPQIVGNTLSLAAKLGTAGISKTRGTIFLEKANQDFFAPRGLKVELVTSAALKVRVGLSEDTPLVYDLQQSRELSIQERRLKALEGLVAPLTFNVPRPHRQTNTLERLSAAQVERQLKKSEEKSRKDREKACRRIVDPDLPAAAASSTTGPPSLDSTESSLPMKARRDYERAMAKVEKEQERIENRFQRDSMKRGGKDADKAERKHEKETRKLEQEVRKVEEEFSKDGRKQHGKEADHHSKGSRKDATKNTTDKEVKLAEKVLWLLIDDL